MKVFAISDLHLTFSTNKPMEIFGGNWENYVERFTESWQKSVSDEDVVLIAGDISWAMKLEEVYEDLQYISNLKGKKVLIKGNHEYWWKSISKVRDILPNSVYALQNDCVRFEDYLICGTRGWILPEQGKFLSDEDNKILKREVIRLELTLKEMQKVRKETDKIICMMHYPPFNFTKNESEFTKLLEKYNVDKVVYGHLHGNRKQKSNYNKINSVEYYLTSCDQVDCEIQKIY